MSQHRVEHLSLHLQPILTEHQQIIFQVLSHFQDALISENLTEFQHYLCSFFPVGGDRYAVGFVIAEGKGDAHQFCGMGIKTCGFGIETK